MMYSVLKSTAAAMVGMLYMTAVHVQGTTGTTASTTATSPTSSATTTNNVGNSRASQNGGITKPMQAPADWNTENTYWRDNYASRPYATNGRAYSTYEPAYRYGVDLYNQNPGMRYDELDQTELNDNWLRTRGNSALEWNDAQTATRDAYDRMQNRTSVSGNSPSNVHDTAPAR